MLNAKTHMNPHAGRKSRALKAAGGRMTSGVHPIHQAREATRTVCEVVFPPSTEFR